MELDKNNLVIYQLDQLTYGLKILMPNDTLNFLHGPKSTLENILIIRDQLSESAFYEQDIKIKEEDKYFRLYITVTNSNNENYLFHSRKLNLNDVIKERDLLL